MRHIPRRHFVKTLSALSATLVACFGIPSIANSAKNPQENHDKKATIIEDGEFFIVNNWYLKKDDLKNL